MLRVLLALTLLLVSGCGTTTRRTIARTATIAAPSEPQHYGIDTLAGAKYARVVRTIPNRFAVGFFAETFGPAFATVRSELAAGRSLVRVHLLWSDSHSFGDRDIPKISKLARRYAPLCAQYGSRLELSPFCEHNVRNPDKYLDLAAKLAPGCTIVNTPWRGGISRRYKNEVHGDHAKPGGPMPYNWSYDGQNAVDSDVQADKRKHAGAAVWWLWHPRLNLKWSMKDTTPRPQRKALPTPEFVDSLEYLADAPGVMNLPARWLAKSHADRHGAVDSKGDKLLVIAPIRAAAVQLKRAGKLVAALPYYGPFDGGGFRYYAKVMGFKLGAGLEVFVNGKRHGVINGGFRCCTYR